MDTSKQFEDSAEVVGAVILGLIQALDSVRYVPIIEAHGLKNIQPDQWYPMTKWVAALRKIESIGGSNDIIDAAIKVSENIPHAPNDGTLKGAFLVANDTYQNCHRNGYVGGFSVEAVKEDEITLLVHTPYPDDYMYGAFYGHARVYCPRDKVFTIYRDKPYNYRIVQKPR